MNEFRQGTCSECLHQVARRFYWSSYPSINPDGMPVRSLDGPVATL
jgi:hypothetical protein